ncbi:MAG: STAS domain-containing protein [Spirochaetales bacterium]|nr:STAS domain-containing protein [Spirochaetales bacterium]
MEEISSDFTRLNNLNTGITLGAALWKDKKDSLVITFNGSLNTDNFIGLSDCLLGIVKSDCPYSRIIFDLKGLSYASSAGIGTLVTFMQKAKSKNIDLILCNLNEKVSTVIETLGFASFLTIVPDLNGIE